MSSNKTPRKKTVFIDITEEELKGLAWLYKQQFQFEPQPRAMIGWVLRAALQHPEQVNQWITQARKYQDAEGVSAWDYMHATIASNRSFRRVRIPDSV